MSEYIVPRGLQYGAIVYNAYLFASYFHSKQGQVRKYTGLPYITHLIEVASILESYMRQDATDEMLAAAYLHDVLEDTDCSYKLLLDEFGASITHIVYELTDIYTSEIWPELNRAKRKELEAMKFTKCSTKAKQIKICDMMSNTTDISINDPKFALSTYLDEKEYMLNQIGDVGYNLQRDGLKGVAVARLNALNNLEGRY